MKNFIKKYLGFIFIFIWKIKKVPFSLGYSIIKERKIINAINDINEKLYFEEVEGIDERIVEYKWLFNELKNSSQKKILDAGSTLNFKYILEKIYKNNKIYIKTLYPENKNFSELGISYIYGDLRESFFLENYFDIIVCISTLEHVGLNNNLYSNVEINNITEETNINLDDHLKVIDQFKKILKNNGTFFLTIPFGKKMFLEHLQQFDEEGIKRIINQFNPSKLDLKFAQYKNYIWSECKMNDCINNEIRTFSTKKSIDNAASARSVCLLKMIK